MTFSKVRIFIIEIEFSALGEYKIFWIFDTTAFIARSIFNHHLILKLSSGVNISMTRGVLKQKLKMTLAARSYWSNSVLIDNRVFFTRHISYGKIPTLVGHESTIGVQSKILSKILNYSLFIRIKQFRDPKLIKDDHFFSSYICFIQLRQPPKHKPLGSFLFVFLLKKKYRNFRIYFYEILLKKTWLIGFLYFLTGVTQIK